VLALSIGPAQVCLPADDQALMYADHGDWASFAVQIAPIVRYRAATAFLEQGHHVTLNLDRLPGACETQYISLQVNLDGLPSRELDVRNGHGLLRVDEQGTHQLTYSVRAETGASSIVIAVSEIDEEPAVIGEMSSGEALRFKLPIDRKDYYLRFSLHGFGDALKRTLAMCQRHGSDGDQRYFESPPAGDRGTSDQSHPIERF
jgi:hypothetical protein